MKSIGIASLVLIAITVVALGTTSVVSADSNTPEIPTSATMYGQRGPRSETPGAEDGILHDELISAFSEAVGVPVVEIESRIEAGETLADIAVSKGFTIAEFQAMMKTAHDTAIDQAVINGDLTQEQADWMKERGNRMNGSNTDRGNGNSPQPGRGMKGQARFSNPDCPAGTQPNQ